MTSQENGSEASTELARAYMNEIFNGPVWNLADERKTELFTDEALSQLGYEKGKDY